MKRLFFKIEMADGRELECASALPDYMLFEKTARKHGWSLSPSENPVVWEAFLGWAALRRTGQYDGTFDDFTGGDALIVDGTGQKPVDPILTEVGTDSS